MSEERKRGESAKGKMKIEREREQGGNRMLRCDSVAADFLHHLRTCRHFGHQREVLELLELLHDCLEEGDLGRRGRNRGAFCCCCCCFRLVVAVSRQHVEFALSVFSFRCDARACALCERQRQQMLEQQQQRRRLRQQGERERASESSSSSASPFLFSSSSETTTLAVVSLFFRRIRSFAFRARLLPLRITALLLFSFPCMEEPLTPLALRQWRAEWQVRVKSRGIRVTRKWHQNFFLLSFFPCQPPLDPQLFSNSLNKPKQPGPRPRRAQRRQPRPQGMGDGHERGGRRGDRVGQRGAA